VEEQLKEPGNPSISILKRTKAVLQRVGQTLVAVPAIKRVVDHTVYLVRANGRRIAIGMPIIAGLIAILAIFLWIIDLPAIRLSKESTIPPVQSMPLAPTELSEFKEAFGPWNLVIETNTVTTKLLLLRENGSVLTSQQSVQFSSRNWNPTGKPPELSQMSKEGNAYTIVTNKGRRFVVNEAQPFVFEQTPAMVYAIRESGVWAISTEKATPLHP